MTKIKLTKNKLIQLRNLVTLVEGATIIGLQNLFCGEEALSQFYKEKSQLRRLLVGVETDITRYISQQQILVILEIAKRGHKIIPILYKKQLIGAFYLNDFLSLSKLCNYGEIDSTK